MLGHQPEEVVGGALLGILTGTIGHLMTKKDRNLFIIAVTYKLENSRREEWVKKSENSSTIYRFFRK